MTEERARIEDLKKIKINKDYFKALQEIDFIIDSIDSIRKNMKENHVSEDRQGLEFFTSYSLKLSFIKTVAYVWNLIYSNPEVAMEIWKYTRVGSANEFIGIGKVREIIINDIKVNPLNWVGVEHIDALAQYYLTTEVGAKE